jgi:hypothetical protein
MQDVGTSERQYESRPLGIFQADVEADVERFSLQVKFCLDNERLFPCLVMASGDPLPIDFTFGAGFYTSPGPQWNLICHYDTHRIFLDIQGQCFEGPTVYSRAFPPEETKGFFKSRLQRFLASRFKSTEEAESDRPGLPLRVVTRKSGLRVHYSPAYFFNPALVFGSPTSPVSGFIQPGRYIFGVVGGDLPKPTFISAEYDIPPTEEVHLVEL